MKNTFICVLLIIFSISQSCIFEKKVDFDDFIGTWKINSELTNYPLLSIIQIEKVNNKYILAAESPTSFSKLLFFVCQKNKDHLTITPANYYGEDELNGVIVTKPTDLYISKCKGSSYRYLFTLNTIYIPTDEKLFQIFDYGAISIVK